MVTAPVKGRVVYEYEAEEAIRRTMLRIVVCAVLTVLTVPVACTVGVVVAYMWVMLAGWWGP